MKGLLKVPKIWFFWIFDSNNSSRFFRPSSKKESSQCMSCKCRYWCRTCCLYCTVCIHKFLLEAILYCIIQQPRLCLIQNNLWMAKLSTVVVRSSQSVKHQMLNVPNCYTVQYTTTPSTCLILIEANVSTHQVGVANHATCIDTVVKQHGTVGIE